MMTSDQTLQPASPGSLALNEVQRLYLDLLKKCLTRFIFESEEYQLFEPPRGTLKRALSFPLRSLTRRLGLQLVRPKPFDAIERELGRDWPQTAETMVGLRRLENLQELIVDVVSRDVPGDLVETGVWRGGSCIFMRGVLRALGERSRRVWACDSFRGLPRPDASKYPADAGDRHWTFPELAVSLEEVRANFARYGLMDDQVRFLPGWFRETLPAAPIERAALLRLDADMYESTFEVLEALYPRVSLGGYVVVDDYGGIPNCRRAVEDFRRQRAIDEPIRWVDWTGVYWQRAR